MAKSWFEIYARQGTPEVAIYGEIGAGGVSVPDFSRAWKALGGPSRAIVRISSPGGDCFVGAAIHDILAQSGTDIEVHIDGLAASMASFIAMCGRKIIIGQNASLMIHNPTASGVGKAADFMRTADLLDSIRSRMLRVYAQRTLQPEAVVSKWLDDETWFDAEAAVKAGFADEVGGELRMAASAFDLTQFKHAPGVTPRSINDDARALWAERQGKKLPGIGQDLSDLAPPAETPAETWTRYNAKKSVNARAIDALGRKRAK